MQIINTKILRKARDEGQDITKAIPSDPIEYGRLILRDYSNNFNILSQSVRDAIFDEAIATNLKLLNYYPDIQTNEQVLWNILEKYPKALNYIKRPTPEMAEYVLSIIPELAETIDCYKIPPETIRAIAKYCPKMIIHLDDGTVDTQLEILEQNLSNISAFRKPTVEACLYVLERDQSLVREIFNPPIELNQILLDIDIENFKIIREPTEEMKQRVMKERPDLCIYISGPLPHDLCDSMLDIHGMLITKIKNPTEDQCIRAFPTYHMAVLKMSNPSLEMIISAIDQCPTIYLHYEDNEEVMWHIIHNHSYLLTDRDMQPNLTKEQIEYLVHCEPDALSFQALPEEIEYMLIDIYGSKGLQYIYEPSAEIIEMALSHSNDTVLYLNIHKHIDIILRGIMRDPLLIGLFMFETDVMKYVALLTDPITIHCINPNSNFELVTKGEAIDSDDYRFAVNFINDNLRTI